MGRRADGNQQTATDASFEAIGGAAEAASAALDGLSHAGPLALLVGVVALILLPIAWIQRRRPSA